MSNFDLAGAARIEVLPGAFSALYGNSPGGVIARVSTAPAERSAGLELDVGSRGCGPVPAASTPTAASP